MGTSGKKLRIGIFGFGNMGQAIFNILRKDSWFSFCINSLGMKEIRGAKCVSNLEDLVANSDIIFLCVKPQEFALLGKIKESKKDAIYISIMAGVKISKIAKIFGSKKVVRTMPNLNLLIGQAVTGYYADKDNFSRKELEQIKKILDNFGQSFRVKKEDDLNSITAISGSGPAYVFLFIEALVRSAIGLGFDKKTANAIAMKTVAGSIGFLENANKPDLEDLISKVKSKGGTTEAALNVLGVNNFYASWQKATKAAQNRAKELSL